MDDALIDVALALLPMLPAWVQIAVAAVVAAGGVYLRLRGNRAVQGAIQDTEAHVAKMVRKGAGRLDGDSKVAYAVESLLKNGGPVLKVAAKVLSDQRIKAFAAKRVQKEFDRLRKKIGR